MSRFLVTFVAVYTCMHAFVFIRAKALWHGRWPLQALFVLLMALMIFAPIATRLLEKSGHEFSARIAAHVSYIWMGFIFLCFWAFLVVAGIELLAKIYGIITQTQIPSLFGVRSTLAVFGIVVLVCLYGFLEAGWIRTEHVVVATDKLPAGVERLKIAQISDVHLGLMVRKHRLSRIAQKVLSENPDIVVSTGDLVDGTYSKAEEVNGILRDIQPPLGKYAVTGNHEYYAGLGQSIDFTTSMGFSVLRGEAKVVGGIINIAGVDDTAGGIPAHESAILSSVQNGLFTLFLKHRPEVVAQSVGLFDLQLSGHTHRGQIFPFNFVTGMVYPMQDGLYELGDNSKLYTSRGTGTWGPPMRVLSPPEVTIIELVKR